LFAVHCFKRIQNQSIDREIRAKMVGDLGKAEALKEENIWEIANWTFISNYPISEALAEAVVARGEAAGIDVSWRGPEFLAVGLQAHPEIREQFPTLQVSEIAERLEELRNAVLSGDAPSVAPFIGIPRTVEERAGLLEARPGGWEYLLFAGVLLQQRDRLAPKWRDHELKLPSSDRIRLDEGEALAHLQGELAKLEITIASINRLFDPSVLEGAFGAPGEPGDLAQIEHVASRFISVYEEMLDWAAALRGCVVPDGYERLYELAAEMTSESVKAIHDFVDENVSEISRIPAYLDDPEPEEPLTIHLTLS
jgi:hypothetical protein